jgi:hypothetical protein
MKLGPWLAENNLKPAQFAPRIGCTSEAVRRYVAGERIPDKATMRRIAKETAGQVTANDFFGIEFATDERKVA